MNILQLILKPCQKNDTRLNDLAPENWHEDFIEHLAKVSRPKLYVELGLYQCSLFNRIEPFANELIGVDINPSAGKYMIKSKKAKFECMKTIEFCKQLKKEKKKIDLLFIDADHSKESVLNDFYSFFPLVSNNGLILLHDGFPKSRKYTDPGFCGDGYKAIWELSKEKSKFELVTIPVHPGLTICRKRTKQVKWT